MAIAPLVLLGSVFAHQHIQANRLLTALAERPLPVCGERYRLLASIPDKDQDSSLIRYLLQQRGYDHHGFAWIGGWYGYGLALRSLTSPNERRDLFARLGCPTRGPERERARS